MKRSCCKGCIGPAGFTLIELLVVVLIMGILAAIALPQYQKAVTKSRMAKMQMMLAEVVTAANAYYLQYRKYPTSFDDLDLKFSLEKLATPSCGSNLNNHKAALKGDGFEISLADVYLNKYNYAAAYFTTGEYKCRGWIHFFRYPEYPGAEKHTFCSEFYHKRACGSGCDQGILCKNVMGKSKWKYYIALTYLY